MSRLFYRYWALLRGSFSFGDLNSTIMTIISAAVFLLTGFLAYNSDLTVDEAYTYLNYAYYENPGILKIDLANNHPFNSFLIYLFSLFLPFNDFVIRLPSLLFLTIYLAISIRLSAMFRKISLVIFGFLVLYWFLTPEFFSQARGYSIAATIVLYVGFRELTSERNWDLFLSNCYWLLLACFAYPGLIPLPLAYGITYLLFGDRKNLVQNVKDKWVDLLFLLFGFVFLSWFLLQVSAEGRPLYGSEDLNFLEAAVGSYLSTFIGFSTELPGMIIYLVSGTIILVGGILIVRYKAAAKWSSIALLTFSIYYLLSELGGKPYITGRLLLPLYPLLILALIEGLKNMEANLDRIKPIKVLSTIAFLGLIINYSIQFTTSNHQSGVSEEVTGKMAGTIQNYSIRKSAVRDYYEQKFIRKDFWINTSQPDDCKYTN